MSIVFDNDRKYKPWKVIKAGVIDTTHRHYGQAEDEIKRDGGDEIRYINNRGFWVTVWKPKLAEAPSTEATPDAAYL